MNKLSALLSLCFLLSTAPLASALGLGNTDTSAKLGHALDLTIPVDADTYAKNQIIVKLASIDAHNAQKVDFGAIPTDLKVEVVDEDDKLYARVTTKKPITQPFVEFVLEVKSPSGNILRNYQVMLDP